MSNTVTHTLENVSILYLGEGLLKLPKNVEHTPEYIARVICKRAMKAEGFMFNDKGRYEWLVDAANYLNDISDEDLNETAETVIDYVANNLIYSNAPHIIGGDNVEVSHDIKDAIVAEIVNLFDDSIRVRQRGKEV
jgi:hypothetical protein